MTLQESKHASISPLRRSLWINLALFVVGAAVLVTLQVGLNLDPKKIPSNLIGKDYFDIDAEIIQSGGLGFLDAVSPDGPSTRATLSQILKSYDVVVLNFWASWCVSCREEAREFEQFWQSVKGSRTLVMGVAIQDTLEEANRFASQFGKTYLLLLDDLGKAAIDYGVTGVPETFVIDKNLKIVFKETGPMSYTKLEEAVQDAIKGVTQP